VEVIATIYLEIYSTFINGAITTAMSTYISTHSSSDRNTEAVVIEILRWKQSIVLKPLSNLERLNKREKERQGTVRKR
jgi:hypothetical protein